MRFVPAFRELTCSKNVEITAFSTTKTWTEIVILHKHKVESKKCFLVYINITSGKYISGLRVIICQIWPRLYRFKSTFKYVIPTEPCKNLVRLAKPCNSGLISCPSEILPGKS